MTYVFGGTLNLAESVNQSESWWVRVQVQLQVQSFVSEFGSWVFMSESKIFVSEYES